MSHCMWADMFCNTSQSCVYVNDSLNASGAKPSVISTIVGHIISAVTDK